MRLFGQDYINQWHQFRSATQDKPQTDALDKCECGDAREEKSIKNASTALLAILSSLRLPLLRLP